MQTGDAGYGRSPVCALRTIAFAQEHYKAQTGKYGDYFNLNDGERNKYIEPSLAGADPDHPNHEDWHGYNVDIFVNADNSDWCCIASPSIWDEENNRNFKITSDGIMYYNIVKGDLINFTAVFGYHKRP
jgi:hypothetical protein